VAYKPIPLEIFDRRQDRVVKEFMEDSPSTYESHPHLSLRQWLESEPLYDWLVAAYQNTKASTRNIAPFIRRHNIDMSEFKPVAYRSYAEFFDREFKEGMRPFTAEPGCMAAFGEARYFGWERVDPAQRLPVKGVSLRAEDILGSRARAASFEGGPVILARLSPMDYHHLHYPDDGSTRETDWAGRPLWTVNWHALQRQPDILVRNERQIHILETDHFGRLGFVEIGALSVGRIVQIHPADQRYARGAEKSVFKFGGSAVVVFGERGAWRPTADILKYTQRNIETLVRLGEPIAERIEWQGSASAAIEPAA
jgi:phosphatidylserine decarboxylase